MKPNRPIRKNSATDVRQLDFIRKQRSEEMEQFTKTYNQKYEGRPIFGHVHVMLLLFEMSPTQYLERPLTDREYVQFFRMGGKYLNHRVV